jgi:hypothetical protein
VRWAGHVAYMAEISIQNFGWKNMKGKYHFGRPRCRCEDNIKMDFKETCWEGVCRLNLSGPG